MTGVNDKNKAMYDKVAKADSTIREMETSAFIRKLMLRGIAVLLTMINVLLFIRMLLF